jgi:cyanophycin synthetase
MDPHQVRIIEAARKLRIEVELLDEKWQFDGVRLTWAGKSEIIIQGRLFSHLNSVADHIAANKMAAKALMRELDIPVPAGITLGTDSPDPSGIEAFLRQHETVVAKPLRGTDGKGVAMHLETARQVLDHIHTCSAIDAEWLLEEQARGEDLRLQYLNGDLVAACIRKPCCIIGDGQSGINTLIDARNRLIQSQNPDNIIQVDSQVIRRVAAAGLELDSVLPSGQELQLKDVSNMAQGGHAIDVTDRVHPLYREYMNRLADALKLRLFSLDVMTPSPDADPGRYARALEFNTQPAWLHHTFSDRRQHDIPAMILKDLFGIG